MHPRPQPPGEPETTGHGAKGRHRPPPATPDPGVEAAAGGRECTCPRSPAPGGARDQKAKARGRRRPVRRPRPGGRGRSRGERAHVSRSPVPGGTRDPKAEDQVGRGRMIGSEMQCFSPTCFLVSRNGASCHVNARHTEPPRREDLGKRTAASAAEAAAERSSEGNASRPAPVAGELPADRAAAVTRLEGVACLLL